MHSPGRSNVSGHTIRKMRRKKRGMKSRRRRKKQEERVDVRACCFRLDARMGVDLAPSLEGADKAFAHQIFE